LTRFLIVALLRLYPRRFRAMLGADLLAALDDQRQERRGFLKTARTMIDLACGAVCEHIAELGRRTPGEMRKGDNPMTTLLHDLRFAARVLLRNPGFTFLAAIALALGIGANITIFTLLDAVVFKPLPFAQPQELVELWEAPPGYAHNTVAPLNFQDWSNLNHSFSSMAAISGANLTLTGSDGSAELIRGQAVTASFFDVLGIPPISGRTFTAEDVKPKPDVVILSERFWRSHFGASPGAIGQSIASDGRRYTIIGVAPEALQIFFKADFWTPFFIQQQPSWRATHFLSVVGRLKPGVSMIQARADLAVLSQNIARSSPSTNRDWGITTEPLRQALVSSDLRSTSWILGGVVGFVLLMSCANVANLLLTRGSVRTREFAIRASIGGTRRRILQQLLTEAALLTFLSGAAGLLLAEVTLRAAPALLPQGMLPVWLQLSVDGRVAGFAIAVTALTAALCGLAPAWQASRTSLAEALRSGGRASSVGTRFRAFLAAGEIAAAVMLVAGAGLLLRSVLLLDSVDPGFHADKVLTMHVSLPLARYPETTRALAFYQGIEREIATVPGVRDIGMGFSLPTDGWQIGQNFFVVGKPKPEPGHEPATHYQMVSTGYFRTLGIPILRGREFSTTDDGSHQQVCIVNEEFARRYLADRDPIGAVVNVDALDLSGVKPVDRVVVGVSHQVKIEGLAEKEKNLEVYVPLAQNAWFASAIAVRTSGDPTAILHSIKAAIARVDRNLPITKVRTMDEVVNGGLAEPSFRAGLVSVFAVLALTLASVGVFGVLAFSVSQRTREFGIRIALGAKSSDVLRLVARDGLRITAAGIIVGLAGAAILTRFLASLLFSIGPRDAVTYVASAAVLTLTALAACAVPALRASRVDPAVALHME